MVHSAYDVKEVLSNCPVKIESVGLWRSCILVACIDGSLRKYAPSRFQELDGQSDAVAISESDSFYLQENLIGFAKKPVSSMDVSDPRNLLITLSDAVTMHRLPGFEALAYLTKTKGASLYAWDDKSGLLAVAKQKKVIIFQYDGLREFSEIKELVVPDVVKSMAWSGDALCLGIRREYTIMNINTGSFSEVFTCGRNGSPLVVRLPTGDLLLGKDYVSIFIDQNGKATHPGGMTWSDIPNFVVIHPPYALARLSKIIEVRYLQSPYSLVQRIPLGDMHPHNSNCHMVSSDSLVVVASGASVHLLLPVPLGVQIVQLTASRCFDEALALCKLLPPEDAALRLAKEDDINKRYGQYLFDNGDYTQAMQQFSASSLDILSVLSLFPLIRLPKRFSNSVSRTLEASPVSLRSEMDKERKFPDGLETTEDISSQYEQWEGAEGDLRLLSEKQMAMAVNALANFLVVKRDGIVKKAAAEETETAVSAMVKESSTVRNADSRRGKTSVKVVGGSDRELDSRELAIVLDTALVQAMLLSKQSVAAIELLKGVNYCDIESCEDFMLSGGYHMALLHLYKYNEMHRKVLGYLNKLAAEPENLGDFQQQIGPDAIIDYLKRMGGQDPSLIFESSAWLVKTCPQKAVALFTSLDPPLPPSLVNEYLRKQAPDLQPTYLENLMNSDMKSFSFELQNELVKIYLDKVLEEYSELQSQGRWDESECTEARKKFFSVLEKAVAYSADNLLKRLPNDGLHEERAILLGQMGQHQLALTLYVHKLRKPEMALNYCDRIYSKVSNGLKASNSTTRIYSVDRAPPVNIYLILLQVYLRPRSALREYDRSVKGTPSFKSAPTQKIGATMKLKGHVAKKIAQIEGAEDGRQGLSSNESAAESGKSDGEECAERGDESDEVFLEEALNLLSCRWDRIDAGQALRMLPSETKLQQLLPFIEPLLRKSSGAKRDLSVIKSLRQSENLQVRDDLHQCRKRVVKITSERTCSICHKRIGSSVFAVYPDSTLVHFVCYRDKGNKM